MTAPWPTPPQPPPPTGHGPYPHPAAVPAPARRVRTWDGVLSLLAGLLLAGCCGLGFLWSLFGMMASDGCGAPGKCNDSLITAAYLVGWGLMGVAPLVAVLGAVWAARRGRLLIVWPVVGLLVFAAGFGGWVYLAMLGFGL